MSPTLSPLASFTAGALTMVCLSAAIVGIIAIIIWFDPPKPREEWLFVGFVCGATIVLATIIALIDRMAS